MAEIHPWVKEITDLLDKKWADGGALSASEKVQTIREINAAIQKHAEILKAHGLLASLLAEIRDLQDNGVVDAKKLPRDGRASPDMPPAAPLPLDTRNSVDHNEPINWEHQTVADVRGTFDTAIAELGPRFSYVVTSDVSDDAGTDAATRDKKWTYKHTLTLSFDGREIARIDAPKFPLMQKTPHVLEITAWNGRKILYSDRKGTHSDINIQATLVKDIQKLAQ